MYVADMDDPCILGMDYFVSNRCELDFRSMQQTSRRRRVPLKTVDRDDTQVKARRTTITFPRSGSAILSN